MTTIVKVGEYEVRHDNGAHFTATRHGHVWRDLAGDNLVLALVSRIEQLEKLWLEPSEDMLNAGIAEMQNVIENLADSQFENDLSDFAGHVDVENVSDANASDMVVFVLQSMAGKLPKTI